MGPTADEVEGNSPAEELERANSKGDEVAHQDQEQAKFRDEARRGINSVPTTGGSELPGGPSGDAAASGRTANKSGGEDDDGAGAGPLAGGGQTSGSGLIGRFNRLSKRKRTGIIGGALGGGGLLIALGFAGILQYELVQIEEKITGYFDNRLKHEIQQELPKFYRKVFAEGGKEEGDQNTGDPITDADHNFSLDTFATDADIAHVDYGPSGEVDALTTDDGERLNVDDATLDDPDSPLMSQLDGRFPGLDFFRVSYRSRILDGDWGIVRNFLASKEEPISDDPATLKSQLDQDVTAAEENTNGAPETESTDEDSAKSDLENTVSDAETNASATVGPASTVMQVCGAESIGKSINRSLWIVRVAQLLRISNGITLDTAHQEKTGDLHASQLAVMMKLFSGFAKSGGWKVLTGVKGASVSGSEKSKFAAKPSGTLANVTSAVSVTAPVCDPINSTGIFGPVLVDISELDPEEDGILTALETAIGSVVKNEIGSKVLGYLAGIATNAASKPILDVATATGADVVDATISGYDNYSNMNEEANGGEVLTPAQVADLNQEANTDDLRAAQQKGIAYQLFSPNYDNSLVSDLLLKFPTSPDDITTGLNSAIAAISAPFNKPQLAAIGSFLSARVPLAQASGSPAPLPEDPAGWEVSQAGLPTALFNAYPDPE
ncbi:MAG TPA: hypothetical protein VMR75_04270, partial [Candidatus Saccharimonadales bacterium]|nr:hypothetical protein [Candidatus Saccharimonadales bacterium]